MIFVLILYLNQLGIMATWIFHEYLKQYANVHISWDHRQINIDSLPKIKNFTLTPKVSTIWTNVFDLKGEGNPLGGFHLT